MEGIRAAGNHLEPAPVDLVGLFIFLQIFKQGGYAVEGGGLVTLHASQDGVNVRGCEKNQREALNETGQHHHHLAVNVKERQKSKDHLPTRLKERPEGNALFPQGGHVVVRQYGRFGQPCGASGVREDCDVFSGINLDPGRLGRVFFEQILELKQTRLFHECGGWNLHSPIGLA